jgi:hypothetical protein
VKLSCLICCRSEGPLRASLHAALSGFHLNRLVKRSALRWCGIFQRTKGVFFYSEFSPSLGDELAFVCEFVSVSDNVRFHFKGHVVRVEHPAPGCAPGVAVSFHPHEPRALWR